MTQDPITTRFIEAFDWLKEKGRVRSARQFAMSIDTYPQSFNDIRKGRRDATLQMVQHLIEKHEINAHYILTGRGALHQKNINGVSTTPKVLIRYLQAHQFTAYASAVNHKNMEDYEWSMWELPCELLGSQIELAVQCDTDRLSSCISKGDILFSRKVPKNSWKSNLSSKRVYVMTFSDNVVIVRIDTNDTDGIYIRQDDRDLPQFVKYADINEIWCPGSKMSNNVLLPKSDQVDLSKLDHINKTLQMQSQSILELRTTIQRLSEKEAAHVF